LVFIVLTKIDVRRYEDLDEQSLAHLKSILKDGDELLQLSCTTNENVQEVKNSVCERLLADRIQHKLKAGTSSTGAIGTRLAGVMERIHVAQPLGGVTRETFIPDAIKNMQRHDPTDPSRRILAKDIEFMNGGAGVYNVDLREEWKLKVDEWRHDKSKSSIPPLDVWFTRGPNQVDSYGSLPL
jgi:nucleolar GTP-binding protein